MMNNSGERVLADNLGKKIRESRQKAGLTQEKLADKLGVSPQAVSKWENGSNMPDIILLPALADVFDITVDELLGCVRVMPNDRFRDVIASDKFRNYTDDQKLDYLWEYQRKHPDTLKVMYALAYDNCGPLGIPKEKALPLVRSACESLMRHDERQVFRSMAVDCMSKVCDDEEFRKWLENYTSSRYGTVSNEVFEKRLQDIGDHDACRVQRYKNNVLIFHHLFHKATRGYGLPEVEAEWYREKIKLIEFLGEDGEAPDAWIGEYIHAYVMLGDRLLELGELDEGFAMLDRAIDLYETRLSKIKTGDRLSFGKKALFGNLTRSVCYDGEFQYGEFTQQDERFNSDYYGWINLDESLLMNCFEAWERSDLLKDNEEFKKRLERAKKIAFPGGEGGPLAVDEESII